MTAKEKAIELVDKFEQIDIFVMTTRYDKIVPKQCALICVNEIIKEHCHESEQKNPIAQDRWVSFWLQVKQQIKKL